MPLKLPILPAQSVPPLDDRGGNAALPPLLSRAWWLFLNSVSSILGAVSTALDDLSQAVDGKAPRGISDTHANRATTLLPASYPGGLYYETDRGAVYLSDGTHWGWLAGTMYGASTGKPVDLGTTDVGFLYASTDSYQVFRWGGAAWAETTPGNDAQFAYASGNITLTVASQDVPGAAITLSRAGRYLISGVFLGFGPTGNLAGYLAINAGAGWVQQVRYAYLYGAIGASVTCQWVYTAVAAGVQLKLQASSGGGGTVYGTSPFPTSISAVWIGA